MSVEPNRPEKEDAHVPPLAEAKASDDMSSSNATDREHDEKTTDAEAGLAQQKPPSGPPGGPPPNGGLTAWLQVLGGFFLFFNTWVRSTTSSPWSTMDDKQLRTCFVPCLTRVANENDQPLTIT